MVGHCLGIGLFELVIRVGLGVGLISNWGDFLGKLWTSLEDRIIFDYYPTEGPDVSKRLVNRSRGACCNRAAQLGVIFNRRVSPWTSDDDSVLREYFKDGDLNKLSLKLGRSVSAIRGRAVVLGLKRGRKGPISHGSDWTVEELNCLYFNADLGMSDLEKLLPGRSACAIQAKKSKLGLTLTPVPWTEEEDSVIRQYYPAEGVSVSTRLPGRSPLACANRANALGVLRLSTAWLPFEDDILYTWYSVEGPDVCVRLPGRTRRAVTRRANKLGLQMEGVTWSSSEDAVLQEWYTSEGPAVVYRLPGRTVAACNCRARRLGLPYTGIKRVG